MGIGVGAAVLGGAVIAGGASLASGMMGASAAKSAASTQAAAANRAADLQLQEQNQVRSDLSPYNQGGQAAANELQSFVNGTNPTGEETMLENTPGYNFALTQGLKSVQNSAAARGLGTSGAALKGAANYATGLAQNTYQSALLNPLTSLMQTGESAAAQTGTLGTAGALAAGQGLVGAGNATAGGIVGAAGATTGALNSIGQTAGQAPLNYLLYNNLLKGNAATNPTNANDGIAQDTTF